MELLEKIKIGKIKSGGLAVKVEFFMERIGLLYV